MSLNIKQTQNQFFGPKESLPSFAIPGSLYVCTDENAIYIGTESNKLKKVEAGGIGEAPFDSQQYVRVNGEWVLFVIPDAADGESAYDIWKRVTGSNGTEEDFLDSLVGDDGSDGVDGQDGLPGKSAYDIWIEAGNVGTIQDFLDSLNGQEAVSADPDNAAILGSDGLIYVPEATQNSGMPSGGLERQVVEKDTDLDNDYSWTSRYFDYLINCQYTGVEYIISSGKVLEASINSSVIFRYIANETNDNGYPVEDSFYDSFSGTAVSGLIVERK